MQLLQVAQIKELALHDENPLADIFVKIGLDTGMRKSEILTIKIENIDTENRVMYVPYLRGATKTGARVQPITSKFATYLKDELEKIPAGQIWLFPSSKSKTGRLVNIDKAFKKQQGLSHQKSTATQ